MRKEICIDNGGTLTDICVLDGADIYTAKTLTTPFDLSQCFFDGLRKVSREIYGEENVEKLLGETGAINYSTTQGTNALVERKGPRLGLIVSSKFDLAALEAKPGYAELLRALVADRIVAINEELPPAEFGAEVIRSANTLAEFGVSRIVICFSGASYVRHERDFVDRYENAFPPHNLGTVPIAVSHETTGDTDEARRIWTAILNAFLHPPMENFLFNAAKRLRNTRGGASFRIFRNDGGAAKVSKTTAIKTYSSGPRAGMEAVRAEAVHRNFAHVVSVDVGGTTSDLGRVTNAEVHSDLRGAVEGIETSIELCDIVSIGVGGGSIIRADGKSIKVGPQSVGSAPGPACFGLGGTRATITDAFVALGLLDPAVFFGGGMSLDKARAESAISREVAEPLAMSVQDAAWAMVSQWVGDLAEGIKRHTPPTSETVLMAFGGAGAMAISSVADMLGVRRILIPKLAAVFSAYGVGFSEISQEYEVALDKSSAQKRGAAIAHLIDRARRDMSAEGVEFDACALRARAVAGGTTSDIDIKQPETWPAATESIQLRVSAQRARRPRPAASAVDKPTAARADTAREVLVKRGGIEKIPVFRLSACPTGSSGAGPAIIEGDYFTGYITEGWQFTVLDGGDTMLERKG